MNSQVKILRRTEQKAKDGKHYLYECLCPYCGTTFLTQRRFVTCGGTTSCGCLRKAAKSRTNWCDLKGRTVGELFVVEEAGVSPTQHILWRCVCSCGQVVIVNSKTIKKGSCGCLTQKKKRVTHLKRLRKKATWK